MRASDAWQCTDQTHQQMPAHGDGRFCCDAWTQRIESMETLIHEEAGKEFAGFLMRPAHVAYGRIE
jgi:hypothetical protein